MNLTDEQIIKALDTPYNRKWVIAEDGKGDFIRVGDLVDFIKRLKVENEQLCKRIKSQKKALFEQQSYTAELQAENERLKNKCEDCAGCSAWKCDCSNIRKEFADRLRDELGEELIYEQYPFVGCAIDNILEEMEKRV